MIVLSDQVTRLATVEQSAVELFVNAHSFGRQNLYQLLRFRLTAGYDVMGFVAFTRLRPSRIRPAALCHILCQDCGITFVPIPLFTFTYVPASPDLIYFPLIHMLI